MTAGLTTSQRRAGAGLMLRSAVFAAWMFGLAIVMGIICLPLLLGPRRWALGAVKLWATWVLASLAPLTGTRLEVRGRERLPRGAALIAAKHQGMMDILAALHLLDDPCIVLKKELMWIPIFGWFSAKTGMVPVDRKAGSKAVRDLLVAAQRALGEGRQMLIYPEGTRRAPGDPPDYKPGVAGLYRELNVPCTPVATNSGLVWPAHGLAKFPGTAVFELLEPIPPGLKRGSFMKELESRIETASNALVNEGPRA